MKIVGIEKRDVYVAIEFSITEILMLASLLDKAEITYDPSDEHMESAVKWLHEVLEPRLEWFQKEFSIDDGPLVAGIESEKVFKEVFRRQPSDH